MGSGPGNARLNMRFHVNLLFDPDNVRPNRPDAAFSGCVVTQPALCERDDFTHGGIINHAKI